MDWSKLSANDKLAVIGAVLAILGAFLSLGGGGSFGLLTGIAMLIIVLLPQFSPSTKLPGSKGSLMIIVGGIAGLGALLALLAIFSYGFFLGGYFIGLLFGLAGGALMGWASWQTFQAEGGKFTMGPSGGSAGAAAPPPPAQAYTPPPPPPAPASPPPSADQGQPEDEPRA